MPTPGDLPDTGIEPMSPTSSALQVHSLPSEPPREPFRPDQFSSVQSLSRVRLLATPWTAACQASLFITNSWSLLRLMSILEKAMAAHSSTLAGESHGRRSLVGCSPWRRWELDSTPRLHFHFSL